MLLVDLLPDLDVLEVRGDVSGVDVGAVTHDSRAVAAGALFCCVPGSRSDGHDHAAAAVAAGAVALLVERFVDVDVPQVRVAAVRPQMARAASALHGHPARDLRIVGITGTNGKTTTAGFVHAILEAHGWCTAVIGTLTATGAGPPNTPDSPELQARLAAHRDAGGHAVAMEVSSHALDQHRTDAIRFDVAVFTNLSRDHLDYHGTMEEYFAAKARLFEPEQTERAVVNLDDPHGRLLRDAARVPTTGYSLEDATDLRVGLAESTFTWRGQRVRVPAGGRFNVANALAALTAAAELGVPAATAAAGLATAPGVPGRLELVEEGQPFAVVVDYAHTPDGLEQLLRAVREATSGGGLHLVFGCGGERDREKRPAMGAVASRLADRVTVTSDNPRSEDPHAIIASVVAGATGPAALDVEPDRRAAIAAALAAAGPGWVVVVAGKGHETTQELAGRTIPFDDREVVRAELRRLVGEGAW